MKSSCVKTLRICLSVPKSLKMRHPKELQGGVGGVRGPAEGPVRGCKVVHGGARRFKGCKGVYGGCKDL